MTISIFIFWLQPKVASSGTTNVLLSVCLSLILYVSNIKQLLYLCQIISDLYETSNISSCYSNLSPQVVYSKRPTSNGYCKSWGSPNVHAIPISLTNQLISLLNFKLKLLGSQNITQNCLLQVDYPKWLLQDFG